MDAAVDVSLNSSSGDSSFFSPLLHPKKASRESVADDDTTNNRSLPTTAHDTSWIGARLSPIHSFDKEDDDDDDDSHEGVGFWNQQRVSLPPPLLVTRSRKTQRSGNERTQLLPLSHDDSTRIVDNKSPKFYIPTTPVGTVGVALCSIAGILLLFTTFLDNNNNNSNNASTVWWMLVQTSNTPIGAWDRHTYWTFVSSWFLCTTWIEYLLTIASWWFMCHRLSTQSPTLIASLLVVLGTAWTGQLWVCAVADTTTTAGCLTWGTAGLLCVVGVTSSRTANDRLGCFLGAVGLCLYNWWWYGNAFLWGCLGASYMGWAVAEAGWVPLWETVIPAFISLSKGQHLWRWYCGTAAVLMVVFPIVWIALS